MGTRLSLDPQGTPVEKESSEKFTTGESRERCSVHGTSTEK